MTRLNFDPIFDFLLRKNLPLAVACSGGSDSMALALMVQDWAKKKHIPMTALTVDHGLRKESGAEAKQVGKWLASRGIRHVILKWQGEKPKSNIQEQARKARYRLLTEYCKAEGIAQLLVAHTLDDQAETVLLRLARGSGVDGLAAMEQVTQRHGITLIRPLLAMPKTELITYLKARGQSYMDDPSNRNPEYDRVKVRELMPQLAGIGLSRERLALAAANMARARGYLRAETDAFLAEHARILPEGYAVLQALPEAEEIALRMLSRLLMAIGGHEVPPRLKDVERLHAALKEEGFRGRTVAGCKLQVAKDSALLILREIKAVAAPVMVKKGETWAIWDRFEITLPPATCHLQLSALTQQGWLTLAKESELKNPYPDKDILYTLPVLRMLKGKIIAVPHLGIGDASARLIPF